MRFRGKSEQALLVKFI